MLTGWSDRSLDDLLAVHGLTGLPETPFPNDGWSGATLTRLDRGDAAFICKRTSWDRDWIARATLDRSLREGIVVSAPLPLPPPIAPSHLGAAADPTRPDELVLLMPDLTGPLLAWERPDGAPTLDVETLDRVLGALVELHRQPVPTGPWPWTPVPERLRLLTPSNAVELSGLGVTAGDRLLEGWSAFSSLAPPAARTLLDRLDGDATPLLGALDRLPRAVIHGDLKLANVAVHDDGRIGLIDWQMVMAAPVALELAWLLVSNTSALPVTAETVLDRYLDIARRAGASDAIGDEALTRDLTAICGLILRGWRKAIDTRDGRRLASGQTAAADLTWWCTTAVAAADRRL